jgi:hypothetical protein
MTSRRVSPRAFGAISWTGSFSRPACFAGQDGGLLVRARFPHTRPIRRARRSGRRGRPEGARFYRADESVDLRDLWATCAAAVADHRSPFGSAPLIPIT